MKVRKYPIPKGKSPDDMKIHIVASFAMDGVATVCGSLLPDWAVVVTKHATCIGCLERQHRPI